MRDESKAAVLFVCLLIPIGLLILLNPGIRTFNWGLTPLHPVEHLQDYSPPPGRFDEFIARYGPPTFEEQSALRPPLFTKWLDYEPEHLRVAFVATQSSGNSQTRDWVLIAFLDAVRAVPVSAKEAGLRLLSRQK